MNKAIKKIFVVAILLIGLSLTNEVFAATLCSNPRVSPAGVSYPYYDSGDVWCTDATCTTKFSFNGSAGTCTPATPGTGTPSAGTPSAGTGTPVGTGTPAASPVVEITPPVAGTFSEILDRVLGFFMNLGFIICPIIIAYGGFLYATSGGDSNRVEEGKRLMIYAIIGLIIVIAARGLVDVMRGIIG